MSTNRPVRIGFFVGPSISAAEVLAECACLNVHVRLWPPVQQGDLLRLLHELPDVVGIIDGSFHQVPAVLHKEILLALEKGARVIGAASIGALRAAELDGFGMEGIGEVYRWYKEGHIDGDDEVAVLHATQEEGYRVLTEPLVNVRYCLKQARRARIVSARTASLLLAQAKRLHYSRRTYPSILKAVQSRVEKDELTSFLKFCQGRAVDLKRADALALVRTVAARVRGEQPWPPRTAFQVQRTKYLHLHERDYVGRTANERQIADAVVLAFHRLFSRSFPELFLRVGLRCLAVDEAHQRGLTTDRERLAQDFYQRMNLKNARDREVWLCDRCLSEEELLAFLTDCEFEAQVLATYRQLPSGAGGDSDSRARLLEDVSARIGLTPRELTEPPFMQPGVVWEAPLIREMKMRGDFRPALQRAAQILDHDATLFQDNPELRVIHEALAGHAREHLEHWCADHWGVAVEELDSALRSRGFLCYEEFLDVARRAYVYAKYQT
jgi:hypothetical protein